MGNGRSPWQLSEGLANAREMGETIISTLADMRGMLDELRQYGAAHPERAILNMGDQFGAATGLAQVMIPPGARRYVVRRVSATTTGATPGCVIDLYENSVQPGNFLVRFSPGTVGFLDFPAPLVLKGDTLLIASISGMTAPLGVNIRVEGDYFTELPGDPGIS